MLPLFALTLFVSAALLFLVQPMVAKLVLPLLGGTPEVWNTCLVFFQALLLAGYAYAHWSTRWLGVRRQAVLHLLLLCLPLAWLPIGVSADRTPPDMATPGLWLLWLLTISVGLPFFAVATTAPLLQRWFAETAHRWAKDPYFLYTASNAGSMLALLSFPLAIEPRLRLAEQAWLWSAGYVALVIGIATCAILMLRSRPAAPLAPSKSRMSRTSNADMVLPETAAAVWRQRMRWLGLPLVPSSWLLGVTAYLTTDIAPVPLLWVLPLSLYMLSFVMVFARRPLVPHSWIVRLFPALLLLLVLAILLPAGWPALGLHLIAFFWGALACHGQLAQERPAAPLLTEFYLWMSLGGMLGGVLNAMVAPLIFRHLLEYPLAPLLAGLLIAAPADTAPWQRWVRLAVLAVPLAVLGLASKSIAATELPLAVVVAAASATLMGAVLYAANWPRAVALTAAVPLLWHQVAPPFSGEVLFTARSFFGVHRVLATRDKQGQLYHHLVHGGTIHGRQSRSGQRRCEPLTYYHRSGPLGQVFSALPAGLRRRVAIVGLGSGAMACYCDAKSDFTFFEIDPLVQQIARQPKYFSYLDECAQGKYRIVLGDGRRMLAANRQHFDMLVLDAFSSDAVPIHLLTQQALQIYLQRLDPHGLLVFHVSNQHLDLESVLRDGASDAGLFCLSCRDLDLSPEDFESGKTPSTYVVMSRDRRFVQKLADDARWRQLEPRRGGRGWTDDYSNILSVLTW